MSFTKIENTDLVDIGVIGLPDTPGLSTSAMQAKLEETARSVVIPKHNGLIDELESTTSAQSLGATPVTGRLSNPTVQAVMEKISDDLKTVEDGMAEAIADAHTHSNKSVLDKLDDTGTGLTYDGDPVGAVTSVNSQTGDVVLSASDVGALPDSTTIPTKTSDLTNDSGFITASDIPTIPTKTSDLTNDSNFVADASYVHTDNNYDATAKGIVDGATAAIAAKSTVAWNQQITTGQKIATVTIDGTSTDVFAPTGGSPGTGAVDSVNGMTGIVVLNQADLNDVTITGVAANDALVYDSGWKNKPLEDVAFSGAYSDLSGTPTLATVATSGSYNDLSNKPTIPAAQVNSDWNASSGVAQILNKPNLATVATSGSYNDLSNKPTIPTVDQTYSSSSTNAQSGTAVASAISGKANSSDLDEWSALAYTNSSGVVAFSLNDSNDYDYDIYCDITPPLDFTTKLSSVTGKGTASCTITYQTTGLPTNTTCKLRILK